MNRQIPDDIVLFLYKKIILPWESEFKMKTGCWDVNRTRKQLSDSNIHLHCLAAGEVENAIALRNSRSPKDFVFFVSSTSQMQDLFRHLRNCAAHASIHVSLSRSTKAARLAFESTLKGSSHLAVSGSLSFGAMSSLVKSLVTQPT